MKEGDRIVCIKEYYCEGPINLGLLFCKGKEYKIHKLEKINSISEEVYM